MTKSYVNGPVSNTRCKRFMGPPVYGNRKLYHTESSLHWHWRTSNISFSTLLGDVCSWAWALMYVEHVLYPFSIWPCLLKLRLFLHIPFLVKTGPAQFIQCMCADLNITQIYVQNCLQRGCQAASHQQIVQAPCIVCDIARNYLGGTLTAAFIHSVAMWWRLEKGTGNLWVTSANRWKFSIIMIRIIIISQL